MSDAEKLVNELELHFVDLTPEQERGFRNSQMVTAILMRTFLAKDEDATYIWHPDLEQNEIDACIKISDKLTHFLLDTTDYPEYVRQTYELGPVELGLSSNVVDGVVAFVSQVELLRASMLETIEDGSVNYALATIGSSEPTAHLRDLFLLLSYRAYLYSTKDIKNAASLGNIEHYNSSEPKPEEYVGFALAYDIYKVLLKKLNER